MPQPTLRSCLLAAWLLLPVLSWPLEAGHAQQAAAAPAGKPAPAVLNPNWLQLPADSGGTGKTPDLKKPPEPDAKFALPDKIELGKSELQFNAGRGKGLSIPQGGIDNSAPSALSTEPHLEKNLPQRPNYFGLQLTTPLH
jgi:hypothetical protein